MTGWVVIDRAVTPERRGVIVSADAERLDVSVSWKPGHVTTLRAADIRSGRYVVIVPNA
jgi:hypothetical protein